MAKSYSRHRFGPKDTVRSVATYGTLLLVGLTLLAFWPGYLSKPPVNVDGFTHFHAAAGMLWLLLVLGQTALIRSGLRSAHMSLGRASYVVAPLFFASTILLAHFRFSRMDASTFAREAYTLYLPLSAALLFAGAYALALVHRRSPRLHGCLMLCTALVLVDPVVGRVLGLYVVELPQFWHYQLITFGIECGLLCALASALPPRSSERSIFLRFAAVFATMLLLWFFVPTTAGWFSFAEWFSALPLS